MKEYTMGNRRIQLKTLDEVLNDLTPQDVHEVKQQLKHEKLTVCWLTLKLSQYGCIKVYETEVKEMLDGDLSDINKRTLLLCAQKILRDYSTVFPSIRRKK